MNSRKQSEIWSELTELIDFKTLTINAEHPDEFQIDLKKVIDAFCKDNTQIIELGSFTGVTSLILDDRFDKTLLDIDRTALDLSKRLFHHFKKSAKFVQGDMFKTPFKDESFNIVFNSGVLEHYNFEERKRALSEYLRILKPNGIMLIAFPNHYSKPYRLAYLFLNMIKKWPYPKEKKLFNLYKEVNESGATICNRQVLAHETALLYVKGIRLVGIILSIIIKLVGYEGYLTVLTIKKKQSLL